MFGHPRGRRAALLISAAAVVLELFGAAGASAQTVQRLASRTETDTTSFTTPYATNGRTRTWAYTYDTAGRVLCQTRWIGGSAAGTSVVLAG